VPNPLKDSLVGAPLALASGVTRNFVGTAVNPTLATVPVAPAGWIVDGASLFLGLAGLLTSHLANDDVYYEITEGALMTGLGYTAQDVTQTIRAKITKAPSSTPPLKQEMRVQPQAPSAPAGGGAQAMLPAANSWAASLSEDF
jgi:hypothetical protein